MKSTGEVMGIDLDFGAAFLKSQQAAGQELPKSGSILITVNDLNKPGILKPVIKLKKLGYTFISTVGTAKFLIENGIECKTVFKLSEGRPNIIDVLKNGGIQIIFNTPAGKEAHVDDTYIRKTAITLQIPLFTTIQAMLALADALESLHNKVLGVCPLQEYYRSKQ
jgi:carbamoyl-phosphate synthase large subunit